MRFLRLAGSYLRYFYRRRSAIQQHNWAFVPSGDILLIGLPVVGV